MKDLRKSCSHAYVNIQLRPPSPTHLNAKLHGILTCRNTATPEYQIREPGCPVEAIMGSIELVESRQSHRSMLSQTIMASTKPHATRNETRHRVGVTVRGFQRCCFTSISEGRLTSDTSSVRPGMTSRVRSTKNIVPQKNVTLRAFVSLIAALNGGPCRHWQSRRQTLDAVPLRQGAAAVVLQRAAYNATAQIRRSG